MSSIEVEKFSNETEKNSKFCHFSNIAWNLLGYLGSSVSMEIEIILFQYF